jgi:hypothetical protein
MHRNAGLAVTKRRAASVIATPSVEFSNNDSDWLVISCSDNVDSSVGVELYGFTTEITAP